MYFCNKISVSSHIEPKAPSYKVDQIKSWTIEKSSLGNIFAVSQKKRLPDTFNVPFQ